MAKEMLINVSQGEECRIALVEDGVLEELYMERTSSTSHVNNIYRGRVTNVEPSIQAAFVDFGLGRNGFLHISDLMPTYFGKKGEDVQESVGRKMARRDRPPIQKCLRRGDEIIVQIIKEGIGTKGPTLTTYISIPGRILVMMPGMSSKGVSRKIEDEDERRRLRQILDSLTPPDDCGFIVRTAGVGKAKAEIQRDLSYLSRLWVTIKKKLDSGTGPLELYTEGDLVTRTVRDVFTADIDKIIVDDTDVEDKIREFFKIAMPRTKNKVELYDGTVPLFHKYGIERKIEQMYSRHVALPSGGSLVIDSTEAIVAIDVNSGKFRDHSDAETTAFKTDLEAADEIPRQLRLRDLGGVIICDFIDLRFERHRRELEEKLHNNLKNDRAKTKMLRMSQFGIIEMTRQRMRPSLKRSIYSDCPHCKGAGLVKTPESMGLDVMRRVAIAINDLRVQRIDVAVCADVATVLLNKKRRMLAELESKFKKQIVVRSDPTLGMDELKLELFDLRDGLVYLEELGMIPAAPPQGHAPEAPRGRRDARSDKRGGRADNRRDGGRRQNQGRDSRNQAEIESPERDELDRVEENIEQRDDEVDFAVVSGDSSAPLDAPQPAMDEGFEGDVDEGVDEGPIQTKPAARDIEPMDDDEREGREEQEDQGDQGDRGSEMGDHGDEEGPTAQTDDRNPRDREGGGGRGDQGENGDRQDGGDDNRRRRRRRRGRGRNRGGEPQQQQQPPHQQNQQQHHHRQDQHPRPPHQQHAPRPAPIPQQTRPIPVPQQQAPKLPPPPLPKPVAQPLPPVQQPVRRDNHDDDDDPRDNIGNRRELNTGGELHGLPSVNDPRKQERDRNRGGRGGRRDGRGGRDRQQNRGGGGQFRSRPPSQGNFNNQQHRSPQQPHPNQPHRTPPPNIPRTGSTDRHLRDDHVDPAPVQRPHTFRDLDHIPEED